MKLILDDGTEAKIKEVIPGHCVVIISPDNDDPDELRKLAISLDHIKVFAEHNITAVAAPRNLKFTVIRDGEGNETKNQED